MTERVRDLVGVSILFCTPKPMVVHLIPELRARGAAVSVIPYVLKAIGMVRDQKPDWVVLACREHTLERYTERPYFLLPNSTVEDLVRHFRGTDTAL